MTSHRTISVYPTLCGAAQRSISPSRPISVSLFIFIFCVHKAIQKYIFGFNAIGLVLFFFYFVHLPIRFLRCINIYGIESKYLLTTGNGLLFSFDALNLKEKKMITCVDGQNCKIVSTSTIQVIEKRKIFAGSHWK